MAELPGGTVTLVFTDIEGSTRLLASLGSRYEAVLADHRRLLRAAFSSLAVMEVDTQGDAFFYAFSKAHDAVTATVEAQQALSSHDFPPGVELRARMGIHSGEPSVTEGDCPRAHTLSSLHLPARSTESRKEKEPPPLRRAASAGFEACPCCVCSQQVTIRTSAICAFPEVAYSLIDLFERVVPEITQGPARDPWPPCCGSRTANARRGKALETVAVFRRVLRQSM